MILMGCIKNILRWMKENCYRGTIISDRCVTGNGMMLGLRSILQWNFQSALKFEGKMIRWTNWMFAALKRWYPMGYHCPPLKMAQLEYRLNGSLQTSSIFHFCGTLVFSIVFYIVSRAIAQMIDREKTCGNGDAEHICLYYSIPDEMRT